MYSNYQARKKGLLSMTYSKADVITQQNKLNKVLNSYKNYNKERKVIAGKHIKLYKENIEFICRMLNQQVMEK
jgi:hypothetical protein